REPRPPGTLYSSSIQQPGAQEVVQLGDRLDLANGGFNVIGYADGLAISSGRRTVPRWHQLRPGVADAVGLGRVKARVARRVNDHEAAARIAIRALAHRTDSCRA